jgi:hypothetical protein
MSQHLLDAERIEHPLDVVERLASLREWVFDRAQTDEMSIAVEGRWANYQVAVTWLEDVEALHVACAFDLKAPPHRRQEILQLIASINEGLWVGHFDIWDDQHVMMFRHALPLAGGVEPTSGQCEMILHSAVEACERYFQAFQFVMWAGKSAQEALDYVQFDTKGRA